MVGRPQPYLGTKWKSEHMEKMSESRTLYRVFNDVMWCDVYVCTILWWKIFEIIWMPERQSAIDIFSLTVIQTRREVIYPRVFLLLQIWHSFQLNVTDEWDNLFYIFAELPMLQSWIGRAFRGSTTSPPPGGWMTHISIIWTMHLGRQ